MKVCVIGTRGFPQMEGGVEKHCESLYMALTKKENIKITVFRRKSYVKDTSFYENIKLLSSFLLILSILSIIIKEKKGMYEKNIMEENTEYS